jgi:hypothetical protein
MTGETVFVARSYEERVLEVRDGALHAFDELPKPVLFRSSPGTQRSTPLAVFVCSKRDSLQ